MTTIVGPHPPLLLSLRKWSKISGISHRELYRRIESGVLRARRMGSMCEFITTIWRRCSTGCRPVGE